MSFLETHLAASKLSPASESATHPHFYFQAQERPRSRNCEGTIGAICRVCPSLTVGARISVIFIRAWSLRAARGTHLVSQLRTDTSVRTESAAKGRRKECDQKLPDCQ